MLDKQKIMNLEKLKIEDIKIEWLFEKPTAATICKICRKGILQLIQKEPQICDVHHCYYGDMYHYQCPVCPTFFMFSDRRINC
jgi:tRNA(Ile)-lysidine synthase TilS/MesJ